MDKTQVNIRLADNLITALKTRAETEGISFTQAVSNCIELGLQRAEQEPIPSSEFYELKARVAELGAELGKFAA